MFSGQGRQLFSISEKHQRHAAHLVKLGESSSLLARQFHHSKMYPSFIFGFQGVDHSFQGSAAWSIRVVYLHYHVDSLVNDGQIQLLLARIRE